MFKIPECHKQAQSVEQMVNRKRSKYLSLGILIVFVAFSPVSTIAFAQIAKVVPGAQSDLTGMQVLAVNTGGRVQVKPFSNSKAWPLKSYMHQWPSVYFETAFIGDTVFLAFDDPYNEYRLFADQNNPVTIKQPGNNLFKIVGLSKIRHVIRLEKVTESIGEVGTFNGFYIQQGVPEKLPPPRRRQIEFIGDSGMTGYGIRSPVRQCTQEEVRLRSDSQIAYPAQVAKHFNADYQINAISGRGMVRNYDGIVPKSTVHNLYPYALFDATTPVINRNWQPQIIIIALGDNDFSTPLKPGEKWENQNALIADYFAVYGRFLSGLRKQNPKAALILIWPDDDNNIKEEPAKKAYSAGKIATVRTAQKLGFRTSELNLYSGLMLDSGACDYHSSVSDHQKITARVITYLESQKNIWNTK